MKCSDYGKNENNIVSVEMEKKLKMGQEENKTEKNIIKFRFWLRLEQKGARMLILETDGKEGFYG